MEAVVGRKQNEAGENMQDFAVIRVWLHYSV